MWPHLLFLQCFLPLFLTNFIPAAKILAGSIQKLQAIYFFRLLCCPGLISSPNSPRSCLSSVQSRLNCLDTAQSGFSPHSKEKTFPQVHFSLLPDSWLSSPTCKSRLRNKNPWEGQITCEKLQGNLGCAFLNYLASSSSAGVVPAWSIGPYKLPFSSNMVLLFQKVRNNCTPSLPL